MRLVHQALFKLFLTLVLINLNDEGLFAKKIEHRHSITPMLGLANNSTTPFSISPSPQLRIDYVNGDNTRIPVTLRYQYRMSHGNRLGFD